MYISGSGLDKELLDKPSMRKHLLHIEELVYTSSPSLLLYSVRIIPARMNPARMIPDTDDPRHE